jgi:hypothetical protein
MKAFTTFARVFGSVLIIIGVSALTITEETIFLRIITLLICVVLGVVCWVLSFFLPKVFRSLPTRQRSAPPGHPPIQPNQSPSSANYLVYISDGSRKYHTVPTCSALRNSRNTKTIGIQAAKARRLTKCKLCP